MSKEKWSHEQTDIITGLLEMTFQVVIFSNNFLMLLSMKLPMMSQRETGWGFETHFKDTL